MTEAVVPGRVLASDSIPVSVELATWGGLPDSTAEVTVRRDGRALLQRTVTLPPPPGRGRRTVMLAPGTLGTGVHALEIAVRAPGDPERRDDRRLRIVEVADLPAAVLVARLLDWEARFLARELADVVSGGSQAYADLGGGRWVDLRTQARVSAARVDAAVRSAALVLTRGAVPGAERAPRRWRWDGGSGGLDGDWYVAGDLPASPLVPRLAGLAWDSLPPVSGVQPEAMAGWQPVLTARLGRRGAQRVVLAARDSLGRRELVCTAAGFWRWAFRGGRDREAFRSLLAAGVEWLLADDGGGAGQALVATDAVVPRGAPVTFRWAGVDDPPDSVALELAVADTSVARTAVLGVDGTAALPLPPGVYRWRARGLAAGGTIAVEEYSPEFVPRARAESGGDHGPVRAARIGLRELWWGFGVAIVALLAEWAWRVRRGLP
jgi:hypothetical protein